MTAVLALAFLSACGLAAPPQITGTIESTPELGGDGCPVLVRTQDGKRWEVTLPDGYVLDVHPEGEAQFGLIGPDGSVLAPLGGVATFSLTDNTPPRSRCQWGTPVEASGVFVQVP